MRLPQRARGQKPRASYGKWAKPLREGHGKIQRFRHSSVSLWPRSGDAAPACPGFLTRCHEAVPRPGRPVIALDGKTLRRSFDHLHDRAAAHVLSAFASEAALIPAHREVPSVPDEVPAVPALVAELGLTGALLTADALHCQKTASPPRPGAATPCWCG